MNILLVTTRLFDRPRSGGEIGTARLMATLIGLGHRLHVVGRGVAPVVAADPAAPGVAAWTSLGPVEPAFDGLAPRHKATRLLAALLSGEATTVQRSMSGDTAGRLRHALRTGPWPALPDVLIVDHLQAWAHVAALQADLPAPVLLMHNVEPEVYAEQASQAGQTLLARLILQREARLLQRFERRALRAAGVLACLGERDALRFRAANRRCGATAPVIVLPPYPLSLPSLPLSPRPPAAQADAASGRRRIGMLGTWTWGPNRHGLQWVLEQVLPRLPVHCVLVLAGTGLEGRPWPDDGRIRWLGAVEDVDRFYDSVDVVAIAAFTGSGVQEKAIEALVRARAVVATPHALRGLDGGLPRHVQVADEPAEFARLCCEELPHDLGHHAATVRRWADRRTGDYRRAMARCLELACRTAPAAPATTEDAPLPALSKHLG